MTKHRQTIIQHKRELVSQLINALPRIIDQPAIKFCERCQQPTVFGLACLNCTT